MMLITFLSHVPQENIPKSLSLGPDNIDLFFHFTEYSILGFLLFRSITSDESLIFHPFYGSLLIGISFAILDEVHQSFVPGRHMSSTDMIFDSLGILFGTFTSSRIAFNSS
jgi:VanZ family protein